MRTPRSSLASSKAVPVGSEGSFPTLADLESGLVPTPTTNRFSHSPIQPLSQPGSPAPGPPAQMDLEHPPQPSFATPTSLLKKEPPGYEETVTQQPKQQVRILGAGVPQARLRHALP